MNHLSCTLASITQVLSLTSEARPPFRPIPLASVGWDSGNPAFRASQGICMWSQGENHCAGPFASSNVVFRSAASASPGSWLEMQDLRLTPDLLNQNCILTRSPCSSYCPFGQSGNKASQKKEKKREKKAIYIFLP